MTHVVLTHLDFDLELKLEDLDLAVAGLDTSLRSRERKFSGTNVWNFCSCDQKFPLETFSPRS